MSRTRLVALAIVSIVSSLAAPAPSSAQDARAPSMTVLPWTGIQLTIAEKQQSALLSGELFVQGSPWRLGAQLSAPLSEATAVAPVATNTQLADGVAALVSFGYDSRNEFLVRRPADSQLTRLVCEQVEHDRRPGDRLACDDAVRRQWIQRHPDDPLALVYADRASRALNRSFIPFLGMFYWSAPGEVAFTYLERVHAYAAPTDAATSGYDRYRLQAGGVLSLYFAPWLAVTARGGVTGDRVVDTLAVDRCQLLPTPDMLTTATACKSTLYLDGAPALRASGYARLAATVVFQRLIGDAAPGIEVRSGLERIGASGVDSWDSRVALFMAPTTGPVLSRFGLGVDVSYAFAAAPDGSYAAHSVRAVTPFIFAGLSP